MRLLRNEEFHFYLGVMGTLATIVAVGLFLDPGTNFGAGGYATPCSTSRRS